MTDDHTFEPPEPLEPAELTAPEDDLVSRVLDGDADDEQRRAVQADPRLRDRLALLEQVRADLRRVEPVGADDRDATINAAMAAATGPDVVTPIGSARSARWRRGLGIVAAVAAAVVLVPVLALTLGRGSETDDSTSADMASPAAGQAESGAATSSPPLGDRAIVDLGIIDTDQQLRAEVDAILASPDAYASRAADDTAKDTAPLASELAPRGPTDCATAAAPTLTSPGPQVLVAVATWRGEPAVVVVYDGNPPVIVVQREDCTVVARLDE